MEADTEAAEELEITEQKVSDQGDIDLGQDGVLGVADEGLDLEVLLNEAEKGLDLPPVLVDVGDGPGGELKIVGQEDVMLAGLLVPITDPAQGGRIVGPFAAGQPDDLVGGDAKTMVGPVSLDDLERVLVFILVTKKTPWLVREKSQANTM